MSRSRCDGLVEGRPGGVEDGLLEAVHGLARGLGDLGERLALEELLPELGLAQAEVVGGAGELAAEGEEVVLARPRAVLAGPAGAELEEPGPEEALEISRLDARP